MHDGPNVRRTKVLIRLRDFWDSLDDEETEPARRALIPEYEVYEPPPSRWKRVLSVETKDFRFGAFIVTLCLAALFVPVGLIFLIADITGLDVPWLSTIAIIMGVGILLSVTFALPPGSSGDG